MRRRRFLQLVAATAVAGVPRPRVAAAEPRIVIAGGGMLGAQMAYRFARRGAAVTLIERSRPASGATSKSFAWINATYSKQPWPYFYLNRLGMAAWRGLDAELAGELPVRWGGSVEWYADERRADRFRADVRAHQKWGYAAALIDRARLERLEPHVQPGPVVAAAHADDEGHVDPVAAVEVLIARARRDGARIVFPAEVTGIVERGGRLAAVRTTTGEVEADVLIVACGNDTARVAAMAGLSVPLKESPGVLVHTAPLPPLVNRVVLAPIAHMKQKPDGRIVTGEGFGGTPTADASREAGAGFLKTAAAVLPELETAALDQVTLGFRPMPKDEFPIVGFSKRRQDVYVTVMHSGVTLSPLIARLAATEILDGVEVDVLRDYRVDRFA